MSFKKVAIASDHGAYHMKNELIEYLKRTEMPVVDIGPFEYIKSDDYTDIASKLCSAVIEDDTVAGVFLCGTGIGASITANKFPGIRAALCHDITTARFSRQHNNANVLCFGARVVGQIVAEDMVDTFVDTPFDGGRHERRVGKITKIEAGFCKS